MSYEQAYYDAVSGISPSGQAIHFAGCPTQDIPANGTATFTLTPNMEMEPTTIKLNDIQADNLELVQASVGPVNLNAGDGPIPGSVFKSNGNFRFRSAVAIKPAQPLRVLLRNKSSTILVGVNLMIGGAVSKA